MLIPAGVCNGQLEVVFIPLVLLCDVAFSILYRRDDRFIVMIGIDIYIKKSGCKMKICRRLYSISAKTQAADW